MPAPFIVSLGLDKHSLEFLSELRQKHFPPERNHLKAHVTLFHALPGEEEARLRRDLCAMCAQTRALPLAFPALRFIGRGIAVDIECAPLIRLRAQLAKDWSQLLGPQDAQGWKHPHVTIQNKVAPEAARTLFDSLSTDWKPFEGTGEGLGLWRYLGGPWELVEEWKFNPAPLPCRRTDSTQINQPRAE